MKMRKPAREIWIHGLWEAKPPVLTLADDPDTFDPVTRDFCLHALPCKACRQKSILAIGLPCSRSMQAHRSFPTKQGMFRQRLFSAVLQTVPWDAVSL